MVFLDELLAVLCWVERVVPIFAVDDVWNVSEGVVLSVYIPTLSVVLCCKFQSDAAACLMASMSSSRSVPRRSSRFEYCT